MLCSGPSRKIRTSWRLWTIVIFGSRDSEIFLPQVNPDNLRNIVNNILCSSVSSPTSLNKVKVVKTKPPTVLGANSQLVSTDENNPTAITTLRNSLDSTSIDCYCSGNLQFRLAWVIQEGFIPRIDLYQNIILISYLYESSIKK